METDEEIELKELQRVYRKWLQMHMKVCRSKRLYVRKDDADKEANRILLNHNRRLESYKCLVCKGFHLRYQREKGA